MKITVLQENLAKIVSTAAKKIPSRPQIPILSNILLTAAKGKISALSTDLSASLSLSTGGKIEESGGVTVPAKDFAALISSLPPGKIQLRTEKEILLVSAESTKAKFVTISASEFPKILAPDHGQIKISTGDMNRVLGRTLFAAGRDESRPILTGIKIETGGKDGLKFISTDGYRLSLATVSCQGKLARSIVVPAGILSDIFRLITADSIEISISEDSGISIIFEDGWVSGRLLAGDFPPAAKIIPDETPISVLIEKNALEQAVRTSAIFAKGSANIVRWQIDDGKLRISANSPQIGSNEVTVEISGRGSGEIAFNSRYLLDYLGSVDSEAVEFGMTDALKPGIFRPEKDNSYLHIIMPVRLQPET